MSTSNTQVVWKDGMHFEAELQGHKVKIDAAESVGGKNRGPTPKPLLLVALGGCTGMDVVSILGKMKVKFDEFAVEVSGEQGSEHPKYYEKIKITYRFKGENLPYSKIKKAVNLSEEKYCGVSAMLGKVADIDFEIVGEGIDYDS